MNLTTTIMTDDFEFRLDRWNIRYKARDGSGRSGNLFPVDSASRLEYESVKDEPVKQYQIALMAIAGLYDVAICMS